MSSYAIRESSPVSRCALRLITALGLVVAICLQGSTAASAAAANDPPTVTPPLPSIPWPQTLVLTPVLTYRFNVILRWTASDADGIASQQLAVSIDNGSFTDLSPAPSAPDRSYL